MNLKYGRLWSVPVFREPQQSGGEEVASDPVIRQAMLAELRSNGSVVSGATYGDVVEQLAPRGVSQTKAKAALNSLAYTTARPRMVSIARKTVGRTAPGEIVVSLLRN